VKEIEDFFADHSGIEFGAAVRRYPYQVIAPHEHDANIIFATKWGCLSSGLAECGPPEGAGVITRYGLPHADDVSSLASIIGNRRVFFLGDLDPTDLLIYLWLQSKLEGVSFAHFGVNDCFLSDLEVTIPPSYRIKLDESEITAVALLQALWPDCEMALGPVCSKLLKDGWKIEQEAVITAAGSQAALLRLLARSVVR